VSVREVKAWTITCAAAYGNGEGDRPPNCDKRDLGPFFAEYESEVPLPEGWRYRVGHAGSHYGYTTRTLFCADCVKRLGIGVER